MSRLRWPLVLLVFVVFASSCSVALDDAAVTVDQGLLAAAKPDQPTSLAFAEPTPEPLIGDDPDQSDKPDDGDTPSPTPTVPDLAPAPTAAAVTPDPVIDGIGTRSGYVIRVPDPVPDTVEARWDALIIESLIRAGDTAFDLPGFNDFAMELCTDRGSLISLRSNLLGYEALLREFTAIEARCDEAPQPSLDVAPRITASTWDEMVAIRSANVVPWIDSAYFGPIAEDICRFGSDRWSIATDQSFSQSERREFIAIVENGECNLPVGGPGAANPAVIGDVWFMSDRDGDDEVFVVRGDGSALVQLTNNSVDDGDFIGGLAVSPRGDRAVLSRGGDLVVIARDGSGERLLTSDPGHDGHPQWSRDGSKVSFHRSGASALEQLMVIDADGSNEQSLVVEDQGSALIQLRAQASNWLPDDRGIVYIHSDVGSYSLRIASLTGAPPIELTATGILPDIALSPDGSLLVYSDSADRFDGEDDLYAIDLESLETRQLTSMAGAESSPLFSPDGTTIAFISTEDRGSDLLHVVDAAGGRPLILTEPAEIVDGLVGSLRVEEPRWSPDSTSLVYSWLGFDNGPEADLSIVNLDGAVRSLAQTGVPLVWSPGTTPEGDGS